jgi:class 3 adenylate cyclase
MRPLDIALLATLGPVWLFTTLLSLDRSFSDHPPALLPIYVETREGPDREPRVRGFLPAAAAHDDFGLAPGDRLIAVAGQPTAGIGLVDLLQLAYRGVNTEGRFPVVAERDGRQFETVVELARLRPNFVSPLLGLTAVLALLRGRGARAARAYALAAFVFSLISSPIFGAPDRWQIVLGYGLMLLGVTFSGPLILRAALLIPASAAPRRRWIYVLPWILLLQPVAAASYLFGWPLDPAHGRAALGVISIVIIAGFVGIQAANYFRADARGRRQLRWILYGIAVSILPMAVGYVMFIADPELYAVAQWAAAASGLFPIFVLIALVHDHLLDIDRLITGTMVYIGLAGVVFALVLGIGMPLAAWLSVHTGLHETTMAATFVAMFALPVPSLARHGQPWLQKTVFRQQAAAEAALRDLRGEVGQWAEPRAIFSGLGERLEAALPTESLGIYVRMGQSYAPAYASGLLIPPALAGEGALTRLLLDVDAPVPARQWQRWARTGRLAAEERALLEHLGAQVVVPIRRGDELEAFACLGPKKSGDLFTTTDLSLLEGVADRVSLALERADQEALLADERALHDELSRYVPGVVSEKLEQGSDFSPGETEVSVFFIDLVGYTARSMGQSAEETFRMVNAYTEAVSARVREHGGAIVEFHGDGLMAVFGAPRALEAKEAAAVTAARAALEALEEGALASFGLRAGVGIATGSAFVGNIQAVDRAIWSVLGNTTNLAARLGGLTRDFQVPIVIDEATRRGAGPVADDFERERGVMVKGREDELDVYLLREVRAARRAA